VHWNFRSIVGRLASGYPLNHGPGEIIRAPGATRRKVRANSADKLPKRDHSPKHSSGNEHRAVGPISPLAFATALHWTTFLPERSPRLNQNKKNRSPVTHLHPFNISCVN
jgi:hypothetical protein